MRFLLRLYAAAALLAAGWLLSGCGGATPAVIDAATALEQKAGTRALVQGSMFQEEERLKLCSLVLESYPPQCGGQALPLTGLPADQVVGLSNADALGRPAGFAWSDFSYPVSGRIVAGDSGVELAADTPAPLASATAGPLLVRFSYAPSALGSGLPAAWVFDLTNTSSQPVTLVFPSGQKAEVMLSSASGEVYRWSEGRLFTQAVEERSLAPGARMGFALPEEQLPVAAGAYRAEATLAVSAPELAQLTLEVVVK